MRERDKGFGVRSSGGGDEGSFSPSKEGVWEVKIFNEVRDTVFKSGNGFKLVLLEAEDIFKRHAESA